MAKKGRPAKKAVPTITLTKKSSDYVVTKEQMAKLRDIEECLGDLRRALAHFDDYETLAKMAFYAGESHSLVNRVEDMMSNVLEDITDEVKIDDWI